MGISEFKNSHLVGDPTKQYCQVCTESILNEKVVQAASLLMANTKGLQLSADPALLRSYLALRDAVDAINKI